MKKIVCFIGVFICSMIFGISTEADVIWVPENSFYETHANDCEYVDRSFLADGPDGEVILYESPESSKVTATWENGHIAHISATYKDDNGVLWGICDDTENEAGWVPMEYMEVIYDAISFTEEYGMEFIDERGFLGDEYLGKSICIWEYPGSENCHSMELTDNMNLPEYYKVYRDEEERKWGYLGYYYGLHDAWICIDYPQENLKQLYPNGAPKHETQEEKKEQEKARIVPAKNDSAIIFAAISVCILVLVTAVLLVIMKKRADVRKKEEKDCRN